MSIRFYQIISLFLFLSLVIPGFVAITWGQTDIRSEILQIKRNCQLCHSLHTMEARIPLKKPLSGLCLDCHPDRQPPNEHVFDIVPALEVEGLPLTEGKITCVTCHDPHKNAYVKMLRTFPEQLCQKCHKY